MYEATNALIGGVGLARNVISGNLDNGIAIYGQFGIHLGINVQNNFIGTNVFGKVSIPNSGDAILVHGVSDIVIGGPAQSQQGNVISGNGNGVHITCCGAQGNVVEGNNIGISNDGVTPLGNITNGVLIDAGASNNSVSGNIIANSGQAGVAIGANSSDVTTGNSILGNSIYNNGAIGIDLANDGITPNDSGIAPNNGQNYPILTSAVIDGANVNIAGSLNGATINPNTTYRIELFVNEVCSVSGVGEGQTLLDSFDVVTDGFGSATFANTYPLMTGKTFITSTATLANSPANTSEFSACIQAALPPTPTATPTTTATSAPSTADLALIMSVSDKSPRENDYILFPLVLRELWAKYCQRRKD
jgi:trimeric autotransporter adhesin